MENIKDETKKTKKDFNPKDAVLLVYQNSSLIQAE